MIFDSPEVQQLIFKYANRKEYKIPPIVLLDRLENHTDEKLILESIFQKANPVKQKDWLARLCSLNYSDVISTWFEIMLANWLEQIGPIEIEPEIKGNLPDFLVKSENQQIVIEAKAVIITANKRNKKNWEHTIISAIKTIKLPYMLITKAVRLTALPNINLFLEKVNEWLSSTPEVDFTYEDRFGNIFVLESQPYPTSEYVITAWTGDAEFLDPAPLKSALKKKASDNKAIREAGYPYVIALSIEDFLFDAKDVIPVWFGNEHWIIDLSKLQVVESRRDSTGLINYRKELLHRTVSGTLVFKIDRKEGFRGNTLKGWYIENPYAKVKVDSSIFPVEARYIVVEKDTRNIKMAWIES